MMEAAYGISSSTVVCVRLFGPLEVSRRDAHGNWQVIKKEEWTLGTPPRSVLKRLLTTPGRRLGRADIEDDLWPGAEFDLADRNLSNALMVLRRILGKDQVETVGSLCGIVGQSYVWTDLDACRALLKEAENQGCTTPDALPLLEEALNYFERGKCLEDEVEKWGYAVRADAERAVKQCRLWLAESYEKAGKLWQAGEQYRAMIRVLPPDEDALQGWIEMLIRQGKSQEAVLCYENTKKGWQAHGFPLSPTFQAARLKLQGTGTTHPPDSARRMNRSLTVPRWSGDSSLLAVFASSSEQPLLTAGESFSIDKDTLPLFANLLDICRHLSEGNELRMVDRILWSFLPKIEQINHLPPGHQSLAASIASQGYLLAASLVGHRNDLLGRLRYSEQALHYGELANDLNLQTVALRQIGISFDYMDRPDKTIEVSQRALLHLEAASPLLQSCIYADLSGAYASLGSKEEAVRYMGMAYEHFPSHPEHEPGYLHIICRYSTLVLFDGLNHLNLGLPRKAEHILGQIDGLHPKMELPERVRIELLNYQVAVFLSMNSMEQACTYLEAATRAALLLGSERHFRDAFSLLLQMQKRWPDVQQVQDLTDLFVQ